MLILGVAEYFMPKPAPPPETSTAAVSQAAPASTAKASTPASAAKAALQQTTHVAAAAVTVETDQYLAIFSNQGGVLTGFRLKKYLNRQTEKPIQLVNADPSRPKPFSLTYDPIPDVNQKMFEVKGSSEVLSKPDSKDRLTFRYVDGNGTVLEKTFGFENGSYLIHFDVTVKQTGRGQVSASPLGVEWADTLGKEENTGTNSRVGGYRVATLAGGRIDSESAKKSQESNAIPSPVSWTALANQFFVAALIPDPSTGAASVQVVRDFNVYKTPTDEDPNPGINPKEFGPRPILLYSGQALKAGESFTRSGQLFFGPQDYNLLKSLNLQLESVVDFGTFGFISVYMLALLKWFFTWCHNWGLAILLLSVAVKLALWFPTHNSYKNMYLTQQKMREVQPKLDALKRKYPDDKQKQQQEQMRLFQEAGINPLGGCLPMLFQLPVFWALYATLGHSIELRQAPFLWISDLTLKDPIYVLPLLMGVTMIIQQRVSGQMATQAAGQQKFMMWFFPIFLTFISFQWPAGLLLYWVVTNLLSMVQQKVVNLEIQKAKKKVEGLKP